MENSDPNGLCEALEALVPAYSLGAADADERAFFEANLSRCPQVAAELADYAALKTALHYSAPLVQPPAALGDRLMESIQRQTSPTITFPAKPRQPIRLRRDVQTLLSVAAIIVLIASNAFWIFQWERNRIQQQQITAALSDQSQILALIASGRASRVQLSAVSSTQSTAPAATLICDPSGTVALLYVRNFPASPPDKVYQLWMRHNGQPVNIGLFKVDAAGTSTVVLTAPQAINTFEATGITLEPAGGSPIPTGQAIVRGALDY